MSEPAAPEPLCPEGMGVIPAGEFLKGWDNGEPDEKPEVVAFTQAYCVDEYEYPNKQGEMPLADVSFDTAAQLCAAQGKHVCNELEWERACRGPRGAIYTNTQDYKQIKCNLNSPGAQASGANPECGNDYGVTDMTGNLWEWVDGTYSEESPWPLIKGGAFKKGPLFASCYARFTQPPEAESDSVGFRCCAAPRHTATIPYASACGENHGPFIPDDILALKQNPDIEFIIYVDVSDYPFRKLSLRADNDLGGSARALVFSKSGGASIITDIASGEKTGNTNSVSADAASPIRDTMQQWLNDGRALQGFNNYWACNGTRIYVFTGTQEYWLSIAEKIVEAADPTLSEIADSIIKIP